MTTAIVVARAGSVRLPGKALLPFAGTTLLGRKVDTLRRCNRIDRVIVGSDSTAILDEAARHGADTVERDHCHCDESRCTANEMIADMAKRVEGDVLVWAHPTNPLVRSETYDRAVEAYETGLSVGFDSLCSVYEVQRHAWRNGIPINYDPWGAVHPPARELPVYQFQDGAIFIQSRARFIETSYFFGRKPVLFVMNGVESTDVDTREDYEAALRFA